MRLRLTVKMERMRCGMQALWRWCRFFAASLGRLVDATCHGLHQLLGIVKITLPQQARAFTSQSVGLIGIEYVVYSECSRGVVWRIHPRMLTLWRNKLPDHARLKAAVVGLCPIFTPHGHHIRCGEMR